MTVSNKLHSSALSEIQYLYNSGAVLISCSAVQIKMSIGHSIQLELLDVLVGSIKDCRLSGILE